MANWIEFEKANKRKSGAITIVVVSCILAIMFLLGFKPPYPPMEPEGLLIDFGTSATGSGTFDPESQAAASKPVNQPQEEIVATQDEVQTISLPDKKNTDKPKTETTNTNTTQTPVINQNELYTGTSGKPGQSGNSEGNTTYGGDQGNPTGDDNGYHGPGAGKGDDGSIGWSLDGRSMKAKPTLQVEHNEIGDVRIKIYVDKNGKVTKAEYERSGSTITDTYLINKAKDAAMKATFNADSKAPQTQIGYITFHFKLQ